MLSHPLDLILKFAEALLAHETAKVSLLLVVVRVFEGDCWIGDIYLIVHDFGSDFWHFENQNLRHIKC